MSSLKPLISPVPRIQVNQSSAWKKEKLLSHSMYFFLRIYKCESFTGASFFGFGFDPFYQNNL